MIRRVFILRDEAIRERALAFVALLPIGAVVKTQEKGTRSLEQNARLHAMIRDVARQIMWTDIFGRPIKMTEENWKRFFLRAYNREALVVPNETGTGFYDLGPSSSELSVSEMSDLMELIAAFGSERGVIFEEMKE